MDSWRNVAVLMVAAQGVLQNLIWKLNSMTSITSVVFVRWHGRRNPNSANSQFFICFDDAGFLDRQYTAWGRVVEGMDNVDKIKRGEPVHDPDSIVSMKVAADL